MTPDLNPTHINNTIKLENTTFTFENAEIIELLQTQISMNTIGFQKIIEKKFYLKPN